MSIATLRCLAIVAVGVVSANGAAGQDGEAAPAPTVSFDAGLSVGGGYRDNVFSTENDKTGDFLSLIEPFVSVSTAGDAFRLGASASAEIGRYASETSENYDDVTLRADGRYRIAEGFFVFGGGDYAWLHEDRSSPDAVNGAEPTKYTEGSVFAGVSAQTGDLALRLGANLRRLDYDDTPAPGLTPPTIDGDDRDRRLGEFGGRLSYAVTPERRIFLQALYDRRDYDEPRDNAGFQRDSDGVQAAVGMSGRFGALSGEALVGVLSQDYDDPAFDRTTVVDVGADLTWRPTPGTTLTAALDRSIEETTVRGASGYVSTSLGLRVSRRIVGDLSARAFAFVTENDYQQVSRKDYVTEVGGGLRYHLTPNVFVSGDYSFEQRSSDVAGADYDAHLLMARVGAALEPAFDAATAPRATADGPGAFYVGVQAGHGGLAAAVDGPRGAAGGAVTADFGRSGKLGGVYAGYRRDIGGLVLGAEIDADYGDADWSDVANRDFGVRRRGSVGASAILGARARNGVLLYGRAGAVGTDFETHSGDRVDSVSDTETRLGLRGGFGAEFPIGGGFSGRMEYALTSYEDYDFGLTTPGDNFANMESVARIGLSYAFGAQPEQEIAPVDFSGFYVGAQIGHGLLEAENTGVRVSQGGARVNDAVIDRASVGLTGGLLAGYGETFGAFYLGLEAEAEVASVNWNIERDPAGRLYTMEKRGAVGVGARAGYVLNDSVLLYGRVGVVNGWFDSDYATATTAVSQTDTLTGVRFGGGVEFAVSDSLRMRLDYTRTVYEDFEVDYLTGVDGFEPSENLFRVGLSYAF